jgi:RNA polymerase sigma-70 factor (ECF subfamily)
MDPYLGNISEKKMKKSRNFSAKNYDKAPLIYEGVDIPSFFCYNKCWAMMKDQKNGNNKENGSNMELFVKLLSANYYRIGTYVQSQLFNNQDTDDVMQEVSSLIWKKFGQFKPGTDFLAWALAIAKFKILEFRKSKKGKHILLSDKTIELIEVDSKKIIDDSRERINALKDCMKKLTEQDQKLLDMRYSYGITVKNIASRTGASIHVIYRNMARIKSILLNCINRKMKISGV